MKIIREITYEGTEEQLRQQMKFSLRDGTIQPGRVIVGVRTLHSDVPGIIDAREHGWHSPIDEVVQLRAALKEIALGGLTIEQAIATATKGLGRLQGAEEGKHNV